MKNMVNNKAKRRKKTSHPNERSDVAKKHKGPASLFGREAEVSVGALKTKSCLSVSEFFLFSGNTCRSSPKSADGEFSLFRFFCSGKRNEKPSRLEREQSDKAQRQLSEKSPLRQLSKKTIIPTASAEYGSGGDEINPLVSADLILDSQMSASKCSQHTLVSNRIKPSKCGATS